MTGESFSAELWSFVGHASQLRAGTLALAGAVLGLLFVVQWRLPAVPGPLLAVLLAGMHDVDDYPQARTTAGLVVYRYDSALFFANAEDFRRRALAAVDAQAEPVAWFILNTEANVEVDITALEAVDSVRRDLQRRGVVFALARVKRDLLDDLSGRGHGRPVGSWRLRRPTRGRCRRSPGRPAGGGRRRG